LSSITPPTDRPLLFEWLDLLSVAMARGVLPAKRAAVAMQIALDSRGTTGDDARIDDAGIVLNLGVSRPTVWRHVAALVESGWMERTSAAIGAARGKPGRRAVYRLTIPTLDLMGKGLPTDVDNSESCSTATPDDETRAVDNSPDLVSQVAEEDETRPPVDNQSRVSFGHPSCLTVPPDVETLPPSTRLRLPMADVVTTVEDARGVVDKEPSRRSQLVAEARAAVRARSA
jgi:hypothetical protein